jgi:hypothetical protein
VRRWRPTLLLSIVFGVASPPANAQDPAIAIPPVERKPYTVGGFLETRPVVSWLDRDAVLYKLRWYESPQKQTTTQYNQQVLLDASVKRGSWSLNSRSVLDGNRIDGDWSVRGTSYEAYASFKPSASFTLDIGKKRLNWGKGYAWNPVAFVDRPKNPDDPALAQEGFVVVTADYIKSLGGPLRTISFTPVLVPVYRHVNEAYGRAGRLNAAGRFYVLLYDTDIDVLFLTGGSRPDRVGLDLSRNIGSSFEVHAELARIQDFVSSAIGPSGQPSQVQRNATNTLIGLRYLTASNITFIADYYHAGTGFHPEEMRGFFEFATAAYDAYASTGAATRLTQVAALAASGFGRVTPMRDYLYVRLFQPDAFGVLYFTPAVYAIVNTADGSLSVTQELQYKPTANLELRSQLSGLFGARGTEFGDKPGNVRLEIRIRYYF